MFMYMIEEIRIVWITNIELVLIIIKLFPSSQTQIYYNIKYNLSMQTVTALYI